MILSHVKQTPTSRELSSSEKLVASPFKLAVSPTGSFTRLNELKFRAVEGE